MEWYLQGILVAIAILMLLAIRMPLGFVFGVVGAGGILVTTGRLSLLTAISQCLHDMLSDFVLITIPLFVLMAELLSVAGFIPDLYASIEKWTGRMRGSLAITTIAVSALFAAVTGSSYVETACLGRMTLPEMLGRGYKKHFAAAAVSAGGSLGILIPPSLAFVIYGYMSGASIAALFMAGIIPGVILSSLFILCILIWCKLFPDIAGKGPLASLGEKVRGSIKLIPIVSIAIVLLGSIYLGVATPAEAAALGCIFSLLFCWFYRKLNWQMFIGSIKRAGASSGFLLLLMGTAKILSFMLAKAGIMYGLQEVFTALPQWIFILIIYLTLTVLGLFLEGTSIIVLTTPIFAPAMSAFGLDLVWYGVILVLFIEIGLQTPPVGMNCYITAEVGRSFGIRLEDVFRGIVPFITAMVVAAILVTLIPSLALWLPSTMR